MSFLSRRRQSGDEQRATYPVVTTLDELGNLIAANGPSSANPDGALRHPYVWRSVTKLGNVVSTLPWHAERGNMTRVEPTPKLLSQPSTTHRSIAWRFAVVESMLLGGGASLFVQTTETLRPTSLDLLKPEAVGWTAKDGWTLAGAPVEHWPLGPLLHIPMYTLGTSPRGVSVIEYNARTITAGRVGREFGTKFLEGGGHPSAILAPQNDPGSDGAQLLKDKFNVARRTGGGVVVLPQSVKYERVQISPSDSQYLELLAFNAAEVAGLFGLQPEAIGAPIPEGGQGVQYSNRENRQADFLQDGVMPITSRIEEALSEILPNPQRVRFNIDGLLRADLLTRYQSYEISARVEQATGRPVLTNDEIRELEHRQPLPPQETPVSTGDTNA